MYIDILSLQECSSFRHVIRFGTLSATTFVSSICRISGNLEHAWSSRIKCFMHTVFEHEHSKADDNASFLLHTAHRISIK